MKKTFTGEKRHSFYLPNPTHRDAEKDDKLEGNGVERLEPRNTMEDAHEKRVTWAPSLFISGTPSCLIVP
jgi:hypothetical protein